MKQDSLFPSKSKIELIHGDCLEVLPDIPDGSVDLTVTSPPYDSLRTYNDSLVWGWDVFTGIAKQLFRVTKKGGVVVWVVGDATVNGSETGSSFRQALYFKEVGFNIHDTMIYGKDGISFPDKNRYQNCFEYMFVFSKGKPKTIKLIADRKNKWAGSKVHGTDREANGETKPASCIGNIIKNNGVRWGIWNLVADKNFSGGRHPAPFPEQLAHDHIISWSNEGDTVLDPMMGSGTTGKMAKRLNRHFIGIEKDAEYFEISRIRIE